MRWLLLDEILKIEKGKKAQTLSRIPSCEFSPEPLLIEMMAQPAGLLLGAESQYENDVIFAKIESVQFEDSFQSGDTIWIEASAESLRPEGAWIESMIRSEDKEIARGRLLLMQVDPLVSGQKKSVTFHEAFMNHFKVRTKVQ